MREGNRSVRQRGLDQLCPLGNSLTRIDDKSLVTSADDVSICPLKCKLRSESVSERNEHPNWFNRRASLSRTVYLSFILAKDSKHPRTDLFDVIELGKVDKLRVKIIFESAYIQRFVDLLVAATTHLEKSVTTVNSMCPVEEWPLGSERVEGRAEVCPVEE